MFAKRVLLALVLLGLSPGVAHAGPRDRWRGVPGSWLVRAHGTGAARAVPVGDGPAWVTVDPSTRTVYVANGSSDTISVIDAESCNAGRASGCGAPVATLPGHGSPAASAIDGRTLYVPNQDGTLSVFDIAACYAGNTAGCGPARATMNVGGDPLGVLVDVESHSVYVGNNNSGTLAVIDGTRCNRSVTSRCSVAARAPLNTAFPFADPATNTIYATTGDTLTILDTRTCNGQTTAGCAGPFPTTPVGAFGDTGGIDPETHTVYVANVEDNTVSVIDGARCNAINTSGCGEPAPVAPVGPEPNSGLVIDHASHSVYVIDAAQDVLSVIDTTHCRAADTSGCNRAWPTLQAGNGLFWMDFDQRTRTVYTANWIDDELGVIDASACSALRENGCRHVAPAVDVGAAVGNMAIDRRLHTVYAVDPSAHQIALVDSTRCAATLCVRHVEPVPGVSGPSDIAIDEGTQTIYVVNQDDRTVALLDATRCNASRNGCAPVGAPVPIPGKPISLAIEPSTHAVYVTGIDDNRLYRIDGAHCRIGDRSRCTPVSGPVGEAPVGVELDSTTGTVYTANDSGTVSVVDARRCCAAQATITVGRHARDAAFDPGTRTLYVANFGQDEAGSVSVIDTRTCNARVISGCGQTPPTLASGHAPGAISVDLTSHAVYTADILHGTISTLDGRSCNALRHDGCDHAPRLTATSFFPLDVLLDADSVYVTSGFARTLEILDAG